MAKQKKHPTGTIAQNKKARHDYFIEHKFEAGLVLSGWEVKSLRAGKAHLTDSYVLLKDGEAWLFGSHITPLTTASTHVIADPTRTRKLLLNKRELERVEAAVAQKGYTCVALALYWSKHLIKCEIALGKGKKEFDKRDTMRERDSNREEAGTAHKSLSARCAALPAPPAGLLRAPHAAPPAHTKCAGWTPPAHPPPCPRQSPGTVPGAG